MYIHLLDNTFDTNNDNTVGWYNEILGLEYENPRFVSVNNCISTNNLYGGYTC